MKKIVKKSFFVFLALLSSSVRAHISIDELSALTQLPHGTLVAAMRRLDLIEKDAESKWCSYYHVFPSIIQRYGLRVGVEIGVSMGGHSESILKTTDVEKLYSIDPWVPNPSFNLGSRAHDYEVLVHRVKSRLGKYGDRSVVIRAFSYDVASLFNDESLDFVFVDGDHHYEAVKQDLEMWYSKVKSGGIVGGDDYSTGWPGVPKAVNEFFEVRGLLVSQDDKQPRIWWVQKP